MRPDSGGYPSCATESVSYYCSAHLGVWRSLVARFVRDEEAVGSNPATPTTESAGQGRSSEEGDRP
jgi:hypothetical protein